MTATRPTPRVALYARYSSDNQRDASIEDQLRQCRERAAREGWTVVETYSDRAISGASLIRSGIQSLLADAQAGRFDMVLSEALDRISRDQEDVAGVFKRLRFAGVTIFTLSEGEINELHVGLKGTMNALFLKDLAIKTHRGIRGRIEAGKIGGGNAYGYRVVQPARRTRRADPGRARDHRGTGRDRAPHLPRICRRQGTTAHRRRLEPRRHPEPDRQALERHHDPGQPDHQFRHPELRTLCRRHPLEPAAKAQEP